MDALETWHPLGAPPARLHVVGAIRPPWDSMLESLGNHRVVYHGWVSSKTDAYQALIRSCRFAYLPTYSEGQVGTLLELIAQGCVPVTTRAAGLDDAVLEHCVLVEPRDIDGQRRAIRDVLRWSDDEYLERRSRLLDAANRRHTWAAFEEAVTSAIGELFPAC